MANFIVAYKARTPLSRERVAAHISLQAENCGQILPEAWWVHFNGKASELRNWVSRMLADDDLLIVAEAKNAAWTEILVDSDVLAYAWDRAA